MHKRFQALLQGVHKRRRSTRIADRTGLPRRWPFRSGQVASWIKDRIGRQAASAELSTGGDSSRAGKLSSLSKETWRDQLAFESLGSPLGREFRRDVPREDDRAIARDAVPIGRFY